MTVSDLYQAVAKLGFESELEDNDVFMYAANRAILQVNAIRPKTRRLRIHHAPLVNLLGNIGFEAVAKDETDLVYQAHGARGYVFEADGHGACYVERLEEDGWVMVHEQSFDTHGFEVFRGVIPGDAGTVRLRFVGEYLYYIRSIALYGRLRSGDSADVPEYAPMLSYDLAVMADDYMGLAAPPVTDDDVRITLGKGWTLESNHILHLPREWAGNYVVDVYRRPAPIADSEDLRTDGSEIDLDEELCALLPTLIASYVWADDEPQKAQYYLSLYREQVYAMEARKKTLEPAEIKSVNGW